MNINIVILVGVTLTVILNIVILIKLDKKESYTNTGKCVKMGDKGNTFCACGYGDQLDCVKMHGCKNAGCAVGKCGAVVAGSGCCDQEENYTAKNCITAYDGLNPVTACGSSKTLECLRQNKCDTYDYGGCLDSLMAKCGASITPYNPQ